MRSRQYSLAIIGGEGDPLTAPTLPLVAALMALDCLPMPEAPFIETLEDVTPHGADESAEPIIKHEHKWIFQDASKCGKFQTAQLRQHWHSAAWLAEHFTHPLARIRAAFHLAGEAVVSAADPDQWNDCEPADLASFLHATATHGPLPACWLAKAHRDAHRKTFPTLARIGDAFALLPLLRAELKNSVPRMIVRQGERRALVPIDATPEEEIFLLSKIDKSNQ